jgi:hypothetical protein
MNLGELEAALALSVVDKSLEEYYAKWINTALIELAAAYELPALKTTTPTDIVCTTAAWLFPLPSDFLKLIPGKKGFSGCADSDYNEIKIYRTLEYLDRLDLDHDDTGDHVTMVAVTDTQIGVYPRANETIHLWYFKMPVVLTRASDVPNCIPEAYHARVIIPKVKLVAYEHLQDQVENFDQKGLAYWQGRLAAGLRGSPLDGPGLIHYLSKIQGGSRRTGGRDPVGIRYYG